VGGTGSKTQVFDGWEVFALLRSANTYTLVLKYILYNTVIYPPERATLRVALKLDVCTTM
jgi:hypothetical protein